MEEKKFSFSKIKRKIKKTYRKYKYMDRTKARFFMIMTIISLFTLFVGGTYSYFYISKRLNSSIITIANLKYQLTSSNTNFKDNSITVGAGKTLSLTLDLKSLNNENTKYALDYMCDNTDVKVMYIRKREQNVLGEIGELNSVINIKILIENNSDIDKTVSFNLKGGYLQNELNSNIEEKYVTTNIMMARGSSSYTGEFWSQAENIKNIVFESEISQKGNAAYTYDVSSDKDEGVMSYLVPDDEDNTKYTLYIQSDGNIMANSDSSWFFYKFTNLENIEGLEFLDTSNVTNMRSMFMYCTSLVTLDVSNFDTSNVSSIIWMFAECKNLTILDLSNFDTSNVTGMGDMFFGCSNLTALDVSSFDTSNVTSFHEMFMNCNSLIALDLSNFKTFNSKSMYGMFSGCNKLTSLNISNFNTSNVTKMGSMFYACRSLTVLDVSNFDTSNVADMSSMFYNCSDLTALDVSNFDTSNVTDMSYMFYNCSDLTALDVSKFKTGNVINMEFMFNDCSSLTTLDVSNFDTSNVTNMHALFGNCKGLTKLDVSNFDTSKVTNMWGMFSICSRLTTLDVSKFNTSNVTNMSVMFASCNGLTTLNVSKFDTNNVTTMASMFSGCSGLTSLDVSEFDTRSVTSMSYMFYNCSGLTTLDVSNFNTNNVTSMHSMFQNCSGLTTLDLSNFDTSNVTDMDFMFYNCSSLTTTITIRGTKCTSYNAMFINAATETEASITVNYTEDASSLVDNMIATKSYNSKVIKNSQSEPKYSITLDATSDITLSSTQGYKYKEIMVNTNKEDCMVISFKVNGTLVQGNTFKMPGENVTISDVTTAKQVIVESEHNPYPNSLNNQEYLNKTFEGATSLTVVLEYQTQSIYNDWIYIYDKNNKAYGKYGGSTLKTETITIPGDTIRIIFRTDSSGNNYYGFKATVMPNY